MPAKSPYSTVAIYGRPLPSYVPGGAADDALRIRAYDTYEDLYHNDPDIFSAVLKTDAANAVFRRLLLTARKNVEAANRYLSRGLSWSATAPAPTTAVDPAAGSAGAEVAAEVTGVALSALDALFLREEFTAKFLAMKRWMLIRGDGLFHITADESKPEGTRLSITELHPGSYFTIPDPANVERVLGCHIVNIIRDDEGGEIAARLTYRRMHDADTAGTYGAPIGSVHVQMTFWETDGWDDRRSEEDLAPVPPPARFSSPRFEALLTGGPLPPQIRAIPVYHFRNGRRGSAGFGVSQLQGLETIINGINQTATDEEVALALNGLGVYWTNSGAPLDSNGEPTPWKIAPGTMLELLSGDGAVGRLEGITSVQPSLDHIDLLERSGLEGSGVPDVAVGRVGAGIGESGVALTLRFMPAIAQNEEKEEDILAKLAQLVHDLLNGWLPAYEGYTPNGVTVLPVFEDPLPRNLGETITQIVDLVTAKIVSARWARTYLAKVAGFKFDADEGDAIAAEAEALLDATGARLDAAVAADPAAAVIGQEAL